MGVFNVVDFKETAKDIFNICTNISKSDGRATEKIEEIGKQLKQMGYYNYISYKDINFSKIHSDLDEYYRKNRRNSQGCLYDR